MTEIIQAMETERRCGKIIPRRFVRTFFHKRCSWTFSLCGDDAIGGVGITNISDWIHSGAWAVGIGSALSKNIAQEGYTSVQKDATKFVEAMNQAKQTK